MMPLLLGPIVIFGYYLIMYSARDWRLDRTISPFAAAWAANAVLLMVAAAIVSFRALGFTAPPTATGR